MGFFGWYPSSLQPQPPPHWKTAFLIVLPRMAWPQVLAASQNIKFTNVDIFTKFIIHMIECYILTKYFFFFPLSVVVIFLYIFFFFDVTMNGTPRHYWRRSQKRKRKFVTTASLSNLGGRRTHQKRAQTIAKQQLWWCPSHKQNTLCGSGTRTRVVVRSSSLVSEAAHGPAGTVFSFDKNWSKFRTDLY